MNAAVLAKCDWTDARTDPSCYTVEHQRTVVDAVTGIPHMLTHPGDYGAAAWALDAALLVVLAMVVVKLVARARRPAPGIDPSTELEPATTTTEPAGEATT
ncbi:MAG: hypothetical protein ACRC8U_06495 [Brooklawnia sp.]